MGTVDFGKIQKYDSERGFGFVGRTFYESHKSGVFFHINEIKRDYPDLVMSLEGGNIKNIGFWYELEQTNRGEKVSKIWLNGIDIPKSQRDRIIADIEWRWRILSDAPPLWLESITVSIVGQERKNLLAQEREKSLSEQRRSREIEIEIEKKNKKESQSRLKALREAEYLALEQKRKIIEAEKRAIQKVIQEKRLREESERQAKILEARKYYERASLVIIREEAERQAKIKIEQEALRVESERQTKLRQENRASEIKTICEEYKIDTLIHFTKSQNLFNIFQKGLLCRSTLEKQSIQAHYNDAYRLDGCRNAISISIGFPNYQMFYKYSVKSRSEWVVLRLKTSVLWELDCAFCQENAASNNVTKIPLENRKQPLSLRKMFSDYGKISRSNLKIPNNYPTHPQSEVLVFSEIPSQYINEIHFFNSPSAQKWLQNYPGQYNNLYYSDLYFSPRSDYQAWSTGKQSIISIEDEIDF